MVATHVGGRDECGDNDDAADWAVELGRSGSRPPRAIPSALSSCLNELDVKAFTRLPLNLKRFRNIQVWVNVSPGNRVLAWGGHI